MWRHFSATAQTINTARSFHGNYRSKKKGLNSQFRLVERRLWVTWWLSRAGLQGARLLGHRFGERVTASDQLPALVALHVSHPHAYAARLGALSRHSSTNSAKGKRGGSVFRAELTSDQGVVYHLKHGLSKQVVSPSGLAKLPPQASSSNIWNFPPLMPTHRTTLRFMPRPQVVLHCGGNTVAASLLLICKCGKKKKKP